MAKSNVNVPEYVTKLAEELNKKMPKATVSPEQVLGDRYRFEVIWPGFEGMHHPDRQQLVWDIAEKTIPPADLLKITMILTVAESEFNGDEMTKTVA